MEWNTKDVVSYRRILTMGNDFDGSHNKPKLYSHFLSDLQKEKVKRCFLESHLNPVLSPISSFSTPTKINSLP
jgi:hypothetical protein